MNDRGCGLEKPHARVVGFHRVHNRDRREVEIVEVLVMDWLSIRKEGEQKEL